MSTRPQLFTQGLSSLSQSSDANSPAEQRDDAKRNFLKTMRALPTQHYWNVWFDGQQQQQQQPPSSTGAGKDGAAAATYHADLKQLGTKIESVQDFWRYNNNTPVDQIKMRESIYLFKEGFRPVWEDRRNINGGSWTFRVPKATGPEVWTHVQLLAIGESLQAALDEGDQICGVGLSIRFNSHLITIWHREASKQKSVDGILACVLNDLPTELKPRPENYYYKKHSDHAGFKPPPELQAVLDSQKKREEEAAAAAAVSEPAQDGAGQPVLKVDPPST